ncbi:hypothetical protein PgNI_05488 [Pyricularia grisea]|uniref:Uncharacterized protein n=1 Tax=Pyricularia grisea TaxID=148305 RepID=A0A6P8B7P6_PYRGI|nr:hypothetical protein PgNI_05488 [Pyricularia grisea]TLD11144.1 hypothetical protein PgNI_05488 [Pyricularia grisea]
MRTSFIALLLVGPTAVLSIEKVVGIVTTGPLCCDKGTGDDSETCKKKGMNSYCCSNERNDRDGGCDGNEIFVAGRTVKAYVATDNCKRDSAWYPNTTFVGFIGCAE